MTALVALLVYGLDQVTKAVAVAVMAPNQIIPVIDGVLQLHLIRNPGAAFSLGTGSTWLLTCFAVVVIVVVLRVARRVGHPGWAVALGLLLAGAAGNLTDRLLRAPGFAHGHVVDFLELPRWPIFNVADASICTAAVLVVVLAVRGVDVDGRRTRGTAPAADPAADTDPAPIDRTPEADHRG